MKTSFFGKGKFKLVLFITLCAVVLGCAIFLCFNAFNKNDGSTDRSVPAQNEIVVPDREVTPTATTITAPVFGSRYTTSGVTINGTSASMTWTGNGNVTVSVDHYNSSYMTVAITSNPTGKLVVASLSATPLVQVTDGTAGTYKFTITAKSGYTFSDGSSAVAFTITINRKSTGCAAPTLASHSVNSWTDEKVTVSGNTATIDYTGGMNSVSVAFSGWENGSMTATAITGSWSFNMSSYYLAPAILNNAKAGTFSFKVIAGKDPDNYMFSDGTTSVTFTLKINARAMSKVTMGAVSNQTYTGSALKPTPAITDGSYNLVEGEDFEYQYRNNTAISTNTTLAMVAAVGINGYSGSIYKTFEISPRNISNANFGTIDKQTYTGVEIKPTPIITDKGLNKTLTNGTDFTFSWSNNVNAGTATLSITGKGNYTGTKSTTFTISEASLSNAMIGTITNQTYDGTEKKPTATVTLGGVTLSSTSDFTFSWSNNVNAGTASLTITGKGNYSGTASKNFTISTRNISNATVAEIAAQAYSGSAKTPLPTLTDLSKTLTINTDYTLKYADNINVGTAKITITGTGNYTGTKEVLFSITQRNIINATTSAIETYYYDGNAKEPVPTVTDGSKTLTVGVDYTISYRDNVNVGTAAVILTGMGNYMGTKEVGFSIQPPTIENATVTISQDAYTYDGTAKEPRVTLVQIGGLTLAEGVNFTVSYSSNINAGTAKVIITGVGDYIGTEEVTFTIIPADLSNATVNGLQLTYTYTGIGIEPAVTITLDGVTLVKNTDYLISYIDNFNVGAATITVTGSRNYTGTLTDNFTIIRADISSATVTGIDATYEYTTTAITPDATVNWNGIVLVKDTDYSVSYVDNTNLGTATVTIAGFGNFSGTITKTFNIVQADITPSTVTGINATYNYTGVAITPSVTLTLNGVILAIDGDFTVTYTDNINKGTATVTIAGIGNYTGVITKNFVIEESDLDDATISGIEATYEYTGSAIAPEPTVTANGITLVKDTDYTVAYSPNVDLGTVTVTVTGIGNFNAIKTITFEIVAADLTNAAVTNVNEEYGYTASAITPEPTVTLNGTVLVKDVDYTLSYANNTDLGYAVITVQGTGNYSGRCSKVFNIIQADISNATVTNINASYEWTGSAIAPDLTVTLLGVTLVKDRDFTIVFTDNTDVGTASYVITGINNYTGNKNGGFAIVKAQPHVDVVYTNYDPDRDILFVGKALPDIIAVAIDNNGATISGTVSWDLMADGSAPTLKEGPNDYNWTFTPDDTDNYSVVTGFKTLDAQKPEYVAIRAEWTNGSQPNLFTSTSISVIKQNLKITGIFSDGATDEIIGGYSFVINGADGTAYTAMPATGGNNFSITVTFGNLNCTDLVAVEIKDVVLEELTVDPVDGGAINREYTALDKFDTASITATAKYNDGSEKTVEFGRDGYTVVYEQGTDYLQFEDTKVILSFTDNGITKTFEIDGLDISKKVFDDELELNIEDVDYSGKSVASGIAVKNKPDWLTVTYIYEDEDGNLIDNPADVKSAGKYKVTAKFTVDNNHEEIEDITATFEIRQIVPTLTPAVGGSFSTGTALSELILTADDKTTAGKLTWDNAAYELQAGINRCYYTFTPDDTVNYKTVHGYVDITADLPQSPAIETGGSLIGWQIALIIICIVVAVIAIVALILALRVRNVTADSDGFYDDVTDQDLLV